MHVERLAKGGRWGTGAVVVLTNGGERIMDGCRETGWVEV